MNLPPLLEAVFLRRENRFRAVVRVGGDEIPAHVPDPGRLTELLVPGTPAWIALREGAHRRTPCDLLLVRHGAVHVSVDSRLPNALFAEALRAGAIDLGPYDRLAAEVPLGTSRIDFRLDRPSGACWVEVKSVTLVEGGVALFPDAPTVRGRRHVRELTAAVAAGQAAAVVFIVQRPDAHLFAPHAHNDPALAAALREAAACGVAVHAYICRVSPTEIAVERAIPVALDR